MSAPHRHEYQSFTDVCVVCGHNANLPDSQQPAGAYLGPWPVSAPQTPAGPAGGGQRRCGDCDGCMMGAPCSAPRVGRIYIAGPMRGRPEHNFPAFRAAEALFAAAGWEVVSPVTIGQALFGNDTNVPGGEYIRADVRELAGCDAIAVLPEWDHSTGARCEAVVARTIGLPFFDAVTGEPIAAPARIVCNGGYEEPAGPCDAPAVGLLSAAQMAEAEEPLVAVCGPRDRGPREVLRVPLSEAWLIWSNQHDAWWGPAFAGYFVSPLAAGLYTREAAEAECDERYRTRLGQVEEEAHRLLDVLARCQGRTDRSPTLADAITDLRSALAAERRAVQAAQRFVDAVEKAQQAAVDAVVLGGPGGDDA